MPLHATRRFARLTAAATVVIFAACAESGTDSDPISPQLMGMGNGNNQQPCSADALAGKAALGVQVDGISGGIAGAVVVVVHPECGPIADGTTDADGHIVFENLANKMEVLVTARVSVAPSVPTAIDIAPPRPQTLIDPLGSPPGYGATVSGPDGSSLLVTRSSFVEQLANPPVEIKNPLTEITIEMEERDPVFVKTFNLDELATSLPLAAVVTLGVPCDQFPWLDQDLCASGAGPAFLTGLDLAESGGSVVPLMAHGPSGDCQIEVLGEQAGVLIQKSAACPSPGETVTLFPRPAVCQLIAEPTSPASEDPDKPFGTASLWDGEDASRGLDFIWIIYGAPPAAYPSGTDEQPAVPLRTAMAYFGDFIVRGNALPASIQYRAKETVRNKSTVFNVPIDVTANPDQAQDISCTTESSVVQVFCASDDGVLVRLAIVHSGLSQRRTDFRFGLDQSPGGDKVPNADQGGGFSLQPTPAPLEATKASPNPCDYEQGNSRFSVKF